MSARFCRQFVQIHKLCSIDEDKLINDVQNLLIETDRPQKSVIQNGVAKYFNEELTELFVRDIFEELNLSPKNRSRSPNYKKSTYSSYRHFSPTSSSRQYSSKRSQNGKPTPIYNRNRNAIETKKVYLHSIIYVAGLGPNLNSVTKLYQYFHHFGPILGLQVKRNENYALIEFQHATSAYRAVESKKPAFGNKLIRVGYASEIDQSVLDMLKQKKEDLNQQEIEMKTELDTIEEISYSDGMTDSESYDIPD